ncbi:hypothetical protein [Aquihabitans sp. G128]|uniref:hyaluronate lyase N-terminal domain-containing protein n=1 Tax=Aquihabitans sp. G128 TaxID=2849779 RepID=UPI0020B1C714
MLAAGEPGYETDTGVLKIGDGTTAWNDLADLEGGGGAGGYTARNIGGVFATTTFDGTATSFTVCAVDPGESGAGVVPDGYRAVTTLDLASMQGLLGAYYPDGGDFLVLAGGEQRVCFLTADGMTEPFAVASAEVVFTGDGAFALSDGEAFQWATADRIGYIGHGVMGGIVNVDQAFGNIESYLDNERHVRGYFQAPVSSTLFAGPVDDGDQPVTDDGQQIVKGDLVATLGNVVDDDDPFHWIAVVDSATGQWGWVPSTGPSTPVGAADWTNSISTNVVTGGSKIFCRSGAMGVFMSYRSGTTIRGGPSIFLEDESTGVWVINDPTAP